MPLRFSSIVAPALTAAGFLAGAAVATAAARLTAQGAQNDTVWVIGALAGGALVAASALFARGDAGRGATRHDDVESEAAERTQEREHKHEIVVEAEASESFGSERRTTTERRADQDWREVAAGRDGLVRYGLADGDTMADE